MDDLITVLFMITFIIYGFIGVVCFKHEAIPQAVKVFIVLVVMVIASTSALLLVVIHTGLKMLLGG